MPLMVVVEPEVADWVATLKGRDLQRTAAVIEQLEARGSRLRMPLSRPLGDGLFELRFHVEGLDRRITYWFAPSGLAVLLATFRKQRQNKKKEVARAHRAMRQCKEEHDHRR